MNSQAVSDPLAAMLLTCRSCSAWAEQDEGPYHRDDQPLRRDIVEDRDGMPLQLGIRLVDSDTESAREATIEIWQCDALGRYSGFPPPDATTGATADTTPRGEYLADQTFLRGRQAADANGMVEFGTIYPGWYPGRTVHIHVRVHVGASLLTSQLYFPDDVTDLVFSVEPYARRTGRDTINATDEILPTGGDPPLLDVAPSGAGYRAAICLVLPGGSAAP